MKEQKWRSMEKPKRLIQKNADISQNYAKFVVEPLESGYGVTIGNSLRRILLSSLPGAAVSSIKIDGALHEFSSIPGVVEDTVELILNIKKIVVKMYGNGPEKLYIAAEGAKEIKALDIKCSSNIEVLNPDLHILTLNEDAKINIELEVTRGRGYVPTERKKKQDKVIGVIPIDAMYSPVNKVTYNVENTRVGQRTDYDRLLLEVWTNGSVSPEDAVAFSAKILKDHLGVFMCMEEEPEEEEVKVEKEEEDKLNELLNKSVDELELSVRSYNCLKASNIKIIRDLVQRSENEMLKFRNFGRKSLTEIKDILKNMGLSFDMKFDSTGKLIKIEKGDSQNEA
ncbi:MAG: DNA-directed RNA polymerase subunit alpha [Candidatus Firestonebacteria bacterium]|nr:DNA-directed RNA polymerase subunit alpha [Candidatus Firestonebacteria bacterium]